MKTAALTLLAILALVSVVSADRSVLSVGDLTGAVTGAASNLTSDIIKPILGATNINAMRNNLKPTIKGLKQPKSVAGALRRALADAPDALVEPVVNLVAAADQLACKRASADGILSQVTDLLKGLDHGLLDQLLKVVENLLKGLNLNSTRPRPPASQGCNILYLQLRGIILNALDLDLDNVCL